eukprot:Skav215895  [mRNA]  locus=scaffold956:232949:236869:- [translate_table: standard]
MSEIARSPQLREPITSPGPQVRSTPSRARRQPSEPSSPGGEARSSLFRERSCPEVGGPGAVGPVPFRDSRMADLEKRVIALEHRVADSADLYAKIVCTLDGVVAKVTACEGKLPAPDAFVNLETRMKQELERSFVQMGRKVEANKGQMDVRMAELKTKISGHEKDLQELKNFRDLRQNSPEGLDKKVQELEEQMAYLDTANAERNRQSRFHVDGVQSELEGHLRELWLSHDDVGDRMDRVEQYLARPFYCSASPGSEEPTAAPSGGSPSLLLASPVTEPRTPDASRANAVQFTGERC